MQVAILTFSPSGNTEKVAGMLEHHLVRKGVNVQAMELARRDLFNDKDRLADFLDRALLPHDVLIIGGPTYAGHLHHTVKHIIKALPKTDERMGKAAVPFVTWGGISSGVALEEAGRLLRLGGRKILTAAKIVGCHALSRTFEQPIHPVEPGDGAAEIIQELAVRIAAFQFAEKKKVHDISKQLSYQSFRVDLRSKVLMPEGLFHNLICPEIRVNKSECIGCGTCVQVCPVQRLEVRENKRAVRSDAAACIHCGECHMTCPRKAISFNVKRFEKLLTNGARGKGLMACTETPKNKVFTA